VTSGSESSENWRRGRRHVGAYSSGVADGRIQSFFGWLKWFRRLVLATIRGGGVCLHAPANTVSVASTVRDRNVRIGCFDAAVTSMNDQASVTAGGLQSSDIDRFALGPEHSRHAQAAFDSGRPVGAVRNHMDILAVHLHHPSRTSCVPGSAVTVGQPARRW